MENNTSQPTNNSYTVKEGDTLNGISKSLGYKNYKDAGFAMPKSGNYDLIMPGEVLTHNGPSKNQLIVSSDSARAETSKYSGELDQALKNMGVSNNGTPNGATTTEQDSDPMLGWLNKMEANSNDASRAIIASIRAAKQNNANGINKQYDSYKRGLQLLGVQSGMSEATPDILLSHVNEAENEHRAKLQKLDGEEAKAIMEAENARNDKNFALFKERMAYVRQLKQDKQNEMKDLYDTLTATKGVADIQAGKIYETLNTLNPAQKEQFLQEVAKKYKISVADLVSSVAEYKRKRSMEDSAEVRANHNAYKSSSGGGGSEDFSLDGLDGMDGLNSTSSKVITAHARRRLNRNEVDDTSIQNIMTNLQNGYTIDEIFASTQFTPRQKRLIQKFIIGA